MAFCLACRKLVSEAKSYHTSEFVQKGLQMLNGVSISTSFTECLHTHTRTHGEILLCGALPFYVIFYSFVGKIICVLFDFFS